MGYATYFSMFIKRKKNRSGTVSIVVAEKSSGFYKEFATIGIAKSPDEIDGLLVLVSGLTGRKNAAIHVWTFSVMNARNVRLNC